MIAEIIIDSKAKSLNRKFDYEIPKEIEDIVDVGSRVLVPFGNFKTLEQGYIIKIKEKSIIFKRKHMNILLMLLKVKQLFILMMLNIRLF